MRVHLIKKQTIENYVRANVQSRAPFQNWLGIIKNSDWERPEDIKSTFGTADVLGKGTRRIVFDIGGNNYRMICKYNFGETRIHLAIKWIGTHAEYDKLCKNDDQYTVNAY